LSGQLHIHDDFHSAVLGCQRRVLVYTPPGYGRDTRRRYPVLYLHDGQNVFDPDTAYVPGEHWRVREAAEPLFAARSIAPLLIVAVYHGGERRLHEYTPTRGGKLGGGGIELHARMMVEELRPFIAARYRVLPHPRHTALGGSSLGGLATLWLGIRYPDVYGKLAAFSPSIWWDRRVILRELQSIVHPRRQPMWLDMGTHEGQSPFSSVRDARLLKATLVGKGWREGRTLFYHEVENADHSERAWSERVAPMLQALFPRANSSLPPSAA
jgi:predicted alpha/beta superfamily hydrolase